MHAVLLGVRYCYCVLLVWAGWCLGWLAGELVGGEWEGGWEGWCWASGCVVGHVDGG